LCFFFIKKNYKREQVTQGNAHNNWPIRSHQNNIPWAPPHVNLPFLAAQTLGVMNGMGNGFCTPAKVYGYKILKNNEEKEMDNNNNIY
jgi:hypothetical protein